MARRRLARMVIAALLVAVAAPTVDASTDTIAVAALEGSTLTRTDEPVILSGEETVPLQGLDPGEIVAFRVTPEGWDQVPVQVDERHSMNLRDVYPRPFTCNPNTQCFDPGNRVLDVVVYSDPVTFSGPDPDATLDADDEIVFMASDAGGARESAVPPQGVKPQSGVEVAVQESTTGTGYVYLFERAAPLDPSAGEDYVSYTWDVLAIEDESANYKSEYRFGGGYNPEASTVTTANYTRGFTDRWYDHELRITRGGASGVDILDRHDATLTFDEAQTCLRQVNSFAQGEGAFVANIDGPVRAIRDYVGANSGPLVQRQHIFYAAKEYVNTHLRVHAIPGPHDFFDYSSAAIGMTYKHFADVPVAATINGIPDAVPTAPLVMSGARAWEAVDGSTQGGISLVHLMDTNNPDSAWRFIYRDNALAEQEYCNGEGEDKAVLYGASGPMASPVMMDTDSSSEYYLFYQRAIFYEAPGEANGPGRMAEEENPLTTSTTPAG